MATEVKTNEQTKVHLEKDSQDVVPKLIEKLSLMFTRKELQRNSYFISKMNHNLEIQIKFIYNERSVQLLTTDQSVILEALKKCPNIKVDQSRELIIPVIEPLRNKLVIKNMKSNEAQIKNFIKQCDIQENQYLLKFQKNNLCRITFNDEADSNKFHNAFTSPQNLKKEGSVTVYPEPENIYINFLNNIQAYDGKYQYPMGNSYPMQMNNVQYPPYDPMAYVVNPAMYYNYPEMYYPAYQNPYMNLYIRKARDEGDDGSTTQNYPPMPLPNPMSYGYYDNRGGQYSGKNNNNNNRNYNGGRNRNNRGGYNNNNNDYDGNYDNSQGNNGGRYPKNNRKGNDNREYNNRKNSEDFPSLLNKDESQNRTEETKTTEATNFPDPIYVPKAKEISIKISQQEILKQFQELKGQVEIHEDAKKFITVNPEIMDASGIQQLENIQPSRTGKLDPSMYTPQLSASTPQTNPLQGPIRKQSDNPDVLNQAKENNVKKE